MGDEDAPANDNNPTGTKIDVGDGRTVVIESDLDNMRVGDHVPKEEVTGPPQQTR